MLFKYKGYDKTGKKVKGTVNANSVEEAGKKLKNQGMSSTVIRQILLTIGAVRTSFRDSK